jgi:4-carboxymuconolactone decarboxylase
MEWMINTLPMLRGAAYAIALMIALTTFAVMGFAQQSPTPPAAKTTRQAHAYPPDVDPDSGFRLPLLKREQLDADGKKAYDDIVGPGNRTVAGLRGPLGIRLYSPKVCELSNALSQYLRFDSGLPADVRELAILTTARELDNQFEWTAHEPVARRAGLSPAAIDVVKYRKSTTGLPEKQAAVILLGRQLFQKHKLDSETFARALKAFGERDLVNLVSLMGTYSSTAMLIDTFDMQLDPDQAPLLPLPPSQ